jgi:hypothetical protein
VFAARTTFEWFIAYGQFIALGLIAWAIGKMHDLEDFVR